MPRDDLLRLEGLGKTFPGGLVALADFNLTIAEGEFLSLLGPSGCGKTTTLRVIAGFEAPTTGRILLDGSDITATPAHDRPVNTVFQDYALFPHMNVAENVGFGLSLRKIAAAECRRRVAEALELVGLSDKASARVQALSGGQKQRVALARAIVCRPRLLLLDEPLAALDAHLRGHMQTELKRLQRDLGTTFVMVTHDQTEALSISDRIVVMDRGRIEQVASPADLYDRPTSRFVAEFIGAMNLLPARIVGEGSEYLEIDALGLGLRLPKASTARPSATFLLGLRPEDLQPVAAGSPGSAPAVVDSIAFHGRSLRVQLHLADGTPVLADLPRGGMAAPSPADRLHLAPRPGAICPLLPA